MAAVHAAVDLMSLLESVVDVAGRRLTWLGIAFEPLSSEQAAARVPVLGRLADAPSRSHHLLLQVLDGMVAGFYEVTGGNLASRARTQSRLSNALTSSTPPLTVLTSSMSFLSHGVDVFFVLIGLGDTPRSDVNRCLREVTQVETIATVAAAAQTEPIRTPG